MAIDRGELRYSIRIRDEFRGPLRRFRQEVDEARRAIENLSRTRATGRAARQATDEQVQQVRAIQAGIEAQRGAERQRAQLLQAQTRERREVLQSIQRAGRELQRQGAAEARLSSARIRGLDQQTAASDRAAAGVRRVRGETQALNREGGRVLFTFRRLFGALAAFTLAREAAGAFRNLVALGLNFNAQLEQGRLGFAGLLTAAGQVRDATGRTLKGQEAFNASLAKAGELQLQLRQRALETTATAEELAFAFQQAIAPGLSRGLDPDQILDLTVGISQAASAIGLAQNQLAEEVRSILQGTARAQTTRLAQLFGGAEELNQLVRGAKTADDLFERLNERLQGTSEAARLAADILPGLFARTGDALALVAGTAASGLFESLEEALRGIFNSLVVINRETGRLEPNPAILPAFEAIFDVLEDLVGRAREFAESVGFDGLVTAGRTLAGIISVVGALLIGVAEAVRATAQVLGVIGDPFVEIVGGADEFVRLLAEVSQVVGLAIGAIGLARVATFLWGAAMRFVQVQAVATGVAVDGVAAATGRVRLGMLGIGSVAAVIVVGFEKIFEAILGVDVTLADTLQIIRLSFSTAFGTVTRQATIVFKSFANNLVGIFLSPISTISNAFNDLILRPFLGAAAALAAVGVISEETRVGLEDATAGIEAALAARGSNAAKLFDTDQDKADLQSFLETSAEGFAQLRADVASRGVLGEGFDADLARIKRATAEAQGATFGGRDEGVSDEERSALDTQQSRIALAQLELAARQQIAFLAGSELTAAQRVLGEGQARINQLRGQLNILEIQRQKIKEQTDLEIQQALGEERKNFLREQQAAKLAESNLELAQTTLEIEAQNAALREQQLIVAGTIDQGLSRGLRNFAEQFSSAFEAGIRIAEGILNRFASFVSQSLVDALDPTKDFDLRERFARFLQDIAQLILQQLIQLAIAKAILGLGGSNVPGAAGGGQVPTFLAEGGRVPGGPSYESRPPSGAPRSDTVLARLTPGEWVDPVSTVSRMGADFFDRLRAGAGDPLALRALVGLGNGRRARSKGSSSGFFQSGGIVSDQLRRASAVADQRQASRENGEGQVVMAVIPGNDQTVERLMSGGKRAMLDFIGENASTIDGMLSRNRQR